MKRTIRELLEATRGRLISGRPSDTFAGVSTDTRTLKPEQIFFALRGPRFDGHDYLSLAAERCAAVVVIDRLDERATFDRERIPVMVGVDDTLRALQDFARWVRTQSSAIVVGVTGSNGKTTTKEMIAAILKTHGRTLATRGNLNNHIGLPLTLCDLDPTDRYAVIEMGTSKPGDMDLLVDLARPQVGLITNVGKDHLEFLGSPEGVLKVNRQLYDRLPRDGTAIINMDDALLAPLATQLPCRIVTYGQSEKAAIHARRIHPVAAGIEFSLHIQGREFPVRLEGPGTFQVWNALAAAAIAHALNLSPEEIVEGLQSFQPAAMRMQVHARSDGALLVNDAYNANPSSVRAAVDGFCQSFSDRPRWLVLGDMRELGARLREEHRELGNWLAQQPLERIFLYGRDTRFVLAGLLGAGTPALVERFRKKRYLIEALQRSLTKNPAVLFKASRVMRLEKVIDALLSLSS